ncbi:MAG: hypothetical protein J6A44_03025 [Paludibacteraceae bacterium]|nr:hypothetical protein [Paludibacteraceae bacterium]
MFDSNYFQGKYRIKTVRADWIDYNNGDFFVTICTKDKSHYFGNIENSDMKLSVIGQFTLEAIKNITTHNPYCEVLDFVIMPNHIHLILSIRQKVETQPIASQPPKNAPTPVETQYIASPITKDAPPKVETQYIASPNNKNNKVETQYIASQNANNAKTQYIVSQNNKNIALQRSLLASVIANFKATITRFANANNITFAWQTRFYDNFIRNQAMMNQIADYVENNVIRWETDCYF